MPCLVYRWVDLLLALNMRCLPIPVCLGVLPTSLPRRYPSVRPGASSVRPGASSVCPFAHALRQSAQALPFVSPPRRYPFAQIVRLSDLACSYLDYVSQVRPVRMSCHVTSSASSGSRDVCGYQSRIGQRLWGMSDEHHPIRLDVIEEERNNVHCRCIVDS